MTKYCYSLDEEHFTEELEDLLDEVEDDERVGLIYFRGEQVPLTYANCINVPYILEQCDDYAYSEIGEIYDSNFSDVDEAAKAELASLIEAWAKKHVKLGYWTVTNVEELVIEDGDI